MNKNSSILRFNPLVLPLLTVMFFLGLEAGFRLYFFGGSALIAPWRYDALPIVPGRVLQTVADPLIGWRLAPYQRVRLKGADLSTNAYGFRDRDIALEKSPGVYRLAVLGASFEMGSGVNDTETYSRQLQLLFDRHLPGRVEVLNFGVFAYNAIQINAAYDAFVSAFKPDAVLVPCYPGFFFTSVPQAPAPLDNRQDRLGPIRASFANLYIYGALRKLAEDWIEPHLAHDWRQRGRKQPPSQRPLVYTPEVVAAFVAARQQEGILVIAVILPRPGNISATSLQDFALAVHRWAEPISGLSVIDTRTQLADRIFPWDSIYYGDNHPNARVHALYAEAIFQNLAPLITVRTDRRSTP